jgi:hypothetical protein
MTLLELGADISQTGWMKISGEAWIYGNSLELALCFDKIFPSENIKELVKQLLLPVYESHWKNTLPDSKFLD